MDLGGEAGLGNFQGKLGKEIMGEDEWVGSKVGGERWRAINVWLGSRDH